MTDSPGIFDTGLAPNPANHRPLTPLAYLDWAATTFPDRTAVIHGAQRFTWGAFRQRVQRLADALRRRGIGRGDTVSALLANTPAMLELHYAVPLLGAVLNAINYRLDAATVAFILDHAEAKALFVDREFSDIAGPAIGARHRDLLVVDYDDPLYDGGRPVGEIEHEAFLASGDADATFPPLADDWDAIALNYTSGTTGNPKGVVYHHRGAYLNALGNALVFGLDGDSVYLWTLPMFHCNGWTYTWAVTAVGGTHVCLRQPAPEAIFAAIAGHGITHLCGAPIILNGLLHAPAEVRREFPRTVEVATGGAAPPSAVIAGMEALGFRVTHLYGLTETYGPATLCVPHGDWAALDLDARTRLMARQGVRYPTLDQFMVADPETLQPVPADGATIGELMVRGNTVMKGYLKNPTATRAAFAGGWFHTGDLGVMHPNGYAEVKDRSKDVIVSGGENISSLEIEEVLYRHPAVVEAAVVARPDPKWGESPCAFVTLKPDAPAPSEDEVIAFCRARMAHFKIPKTVVFGPLPKTSTGKVQKYVLRERAAEVGQQADDGS